MTRERYLEIVRGFQGGSIVVLGDIMMDEYLWGRATRISPESPVIRQAERSFTASVMKKSRSPFRGARCSRGSYLSLSYPYSC